MLRRLLPWVLVALLGACTHDPLHPIGAPMVVVTLDPAGTPEWVVERVQLAIDLWALHGLYFLIIEGGEVVLHDMDDYPQPRGADGFETDEFGTPINAYLRGSDGVRHVYVAEDVGDRNQTCMIARVLSYAVGMSAVRPHPSEPEALLDYTRRQLSDEPCPWSRVDAIELCRSTGICEDVPPG